MSRPSETLSFFDKNKKFLWKAEVDPAYNIPLNILRELNAPETYAGIKVKAEYCISRFWFENKETIKVFKISLKPDHFSIVVVREITRYKKNLDNFPIP